MKLSAGRHRLAAIALWLATAGCADPAEVELTSSAASATTPPTANFAPPLVGTGSAPTAQPTQPVRRAPRPCAASLLHDGPLDGRTSATLERCEKLPRLQKGSPRCGSETRRSFNHQRFLDAVPAFGDETRALLFSTFDKGKKLGRDPRVFGLLGDSITVSYDFLRGFGGTDALTLSTFAVEPLSIGTPDGASVVDFFRAGVAEDGAGRPTNPFRAFRAAKVGARASYAFDPQEKPLAELLRRLNPAYVVVAFGANDAAFRKAPPEDLAREFEGHLLAIIDALLEAGVVPIVSNEMRHGDQPGVKACPSDGEPNDWRVATATNATSARAAEVACRRNVPLIDLRHALEGASNHGLGEDSVHLSTFKEGADVLDERGLDCGNNVRNYVTLMGLARVVRTLGERYPFEPSGASSSGGTSQKNKKPAP